MVLIKHTLPYSGVEHQKADWIGIHEKICQLLVPLRTPVPFVSSDEERIHREQQMIIRQVNYVLLNVIVFFKSSAKALGQKMHSIAGIPI